MPGLKFSFFWLLSWVFFFTFSTIIPLILNVPSHLSHFSPYEETNLFHDLVFVDDLQIFSSASCLFGLNVCATTVKMLHLGCFQQTCHHFPLVPSWSFSPPWHNTHSYLSFLSSAPELRVLSRKTNNFNSTSKPQFVSDPFQPIQYHHSSLEHYLFPRPQKWSSLFFPLGTYIIYITTLSFLNLLLLCQWP